MSPIDRLAAHLLNLYWTGAGDAGIEDAVINFNDCINDEKQIEDALEQGRHTILRRKNGFSVSLTDHFKMLAKNILKDLVNNIN